VVTLARPSESRASERSAFKAATAGWSSVLGFELAAGCALIAEWDIGCVLAVAEVADRVGLRLLAVASAGLGILDCVLTTPRFWAECFLRTTSPTEDPTMPTSARVPNIQASACMVVLT
jgi:hypothetical protein